MTARHIAHSNTININNMAINDRKRKKYNSLESRTSTPDIWLNRVECDTMRRERETLRNTRNARLAARDAQYEANFGHLKPRSFVSDGVVWRNYGTVPACSEPKMKPIFSEVS